MALIAAAHEAIDGKVLRVAQLIRDDTYGLLRHAQNLNTVPGVESVFVGPTAARQAIGAARFIASSLPRRPSPRTLAEARRLARELLPFAVDAIHAHSVAALPAALPLARWLRVPLIHSPHALPVRGLSGRWLEVQLAMGLIRAAAMGGASFVSVSEGERRLLNSAAGRRPNILVLNPVSQRFLSPATQEREPHMILSLSRFWPQKAPTLTVESFARLASQEPRASLVWAGDGPDLNACRSLAERLGVADRVEFLGRVADPLPLLHRASVFLSTSSFEAMPYSILEAMAAGATVVATDIPAHREIDSGQSGLRLCPADAVQLGDAMATALSHPRRSDGQRAIARGLVESRHSPAAFEENMAAAYRALIPGAEGGVPEARAA